MRDKHKCFVVTSLLGNLLVHIIAEIDAPVANKKQNKLPFCFLEGFSPTLASLMVTDVTAERNDKGPLHTWQLLI